MNWFLLALIPPALWAICNHIDKYLLGKYIKKNGAGGLLIFTAILGLLLLPVVFMINPNVISIPFSKALLISINGIIFMMASLPYYFALKEEEASTTIPLFQFVPVFVFVLGFLILGETLESAKLVGGLLILAGAIIISIDMGEKMRFKSKVVLSMILSSFLYALNLLLFKLFTIDSDFWTTSFWEYFGFVLGGVFFLIFIKPFRNQFIELITQNTIPILLIGGVNELLNVTAKGAFNFISLFTPIALLSIVDGIQPIFVFVYGVFLTIFFPHISKENLSKKNLSQKIISILIVFVGCWLINR